MGDWRMEYVYFGEIQDFIKERFERHHKGMAFSQAVSYLRSQKKFHSGLPCYPDFCRWDTSDLGMLKKLAYQIPISFDEIDLVHTTYDIQSHTYSLSEKRKVQICLDSIYVTEGFTAIPYISIIYVLKGEASFYTHSDHYDLSPGSLLILSPQLPYRLFCTSGDIVLNIASSKELFQQHFSQILSHNELLLNFFNQTFVKDNKGFLHFILPPNTEILEIIKHLFAEFTTEDSFSTGIFLNYLQILYAYILRNCDVGIDTNNLKYLKISAMPVLLQYIEKNFQTVTLTDLAEKFNYAPAYLSRLIKQETGQTLSAIKTDLKLSYACKLLLSTSYSIEKVSELSGYNSSDHFTYCFRKKYQESPRNFRNRQ